MELWVRFSGQTSSLTTVAIVCITQLDPCQLFGSHKVAFPHAFSHTQVGQVQVAHVTVATHRHSLLKTPNDQCPVANRKNIERENGIERAALDESSEKCGRGYEAGRRSEKGKLPRLDR